MRFNEQEQAAQQFWLEYTERINTPRECMDWKDLGIEGLCS